MKKWFDLPGKEQEVVVSSRIRLARNVKGYLFETRMNAHEKRRLINDVRAAVEGISLGPENQLSFYDMEKLTKMERTALAQQHAVSPNYVTNPIGKGLLLSTDHATAMMLGEEDHIRLQVVGTGLEFAKTYQFADEVDTMLEGRLPFAYDTRLGFLTACPTNVGTGLRASVMVHLPLMEIKGGIAPIAEQLSKIGFTIRGTFGEGSTATGSLYQISNQITLGISEQESIQSLLVVVGQIIAHEMTLRKEADGLFLADQVNRAFGVLSNARILSYPELLEKSGLLRLGISLGYFPRLTYTDIDRFQFGLGDAVLQNSKKTKTMDLGAKRAEIVRQVLAEKER